MKRFTFERESAVVLAFPEIREVARFVVFGTPAPQGSKRHIGNGRMIESSKKVKPWRSAVETEAQTFLTAYELTNQTPWIPIDGPIVLSVVFTLVRPKSYSRHIIFQTKYPDLSKLVRSTEDAITSAGMWADDARVIGFRDTWKLYVGHPSALPEPGAVIRIYVPTHSVSRLTLDHRASP